MIRATGLSAIWAAQLWLGSSMNSTQPGSEGAKCPGSISVSTDPEPLHIDMTNAYWNVPGDPAGDVEVDAGVITVHMKGRTYFSKTCEVGSFDHKRYTGLQLLGKRISWTTYLNGADCGCNAAVYLVSLPQNPQVSDCKDYYCDANKVCGVRCTEIDLQEANRHAFHSVLHLAEDGGGEGLGYGGGGEGWSNSRDWTKAQYGPGASCIDTTKAFQVSVSFPTFQKDGELRVRALVTKLSQDGCDLEASIQTSSYVFAGEDSSKELTEALKEGMTPVVSYWSAENMLWMDGQGADGLGPCHTDDPEQCSATVQFSDFVVESLPEPVRLI